MSGRCRCLAAVLAALGSAGLIASASGRASPSRGTGRLSAEEARAIAIDAYVYGYPLVTMEMTRRVMTNTAAIGVSRAPMGQLLRMRGYPSASFRDVTAPNADTLYVNAFVNVKDEPWVLGLPETGGRYALFPLLSGWTDVFEAPGKRTTGTGAQTYAITGPNWAGTLPPGVVEHRSPTAIVWLLGRVYCTGTPEDYAAVHKLEDEISLAPLSSYGKPYEPPTGSVDPGVDMSTPVREQVNNLGAQEYFGLLAALMKDNPPARADKPVLEEMAKLGVVPGGKFDLHKLGGAAASAVASAPKDGYAKIMAHFHSIGAVNGWRFTTKTGQYGDDYLQRAAITAVGLGANLPQDAVYPSSDEDSEGAPYDGAGRYVLHFDKGQLPPAEGFWSLTMYDAGFFFADNPLDRHTLSQRDDFVLNQDGSVDLYLQHDSPGADKEANWLPAPSGKFNLMMRLYWPKQTPPSIIDGTWKPPAVRRV